MGFLIWYLVPMQRRTAYNLTWTMRWINRHPLNHDEQRIQANQTAVQPLVIVIIHESWTLRWADEAEAPLLPKATE